MDRDQIIELLQVISAYDNRNIDELTIRTWSEASRRGGHWKANEAFDAVHDHFAKSTAWVMPAHITEIIRAKRRQPLSSKEVLALDKPVASPERRAEFMRMIRQIADKKADLNG